MKITLNIEYRTVWGESIYVYGNIPELGSDNRNAGRQLVMHDNDKWSVEFEIKSNIKSFEYTYFVRREGTKDRDEWGARHSVAIAKAVKSIVVFDNWQDMPWNKPYYSTAFTNCINRRKDSENAIVPQCATVMIQVAAPMVRPNEALAIVGDNPELGDWNPEKAILLNAANFPVWSGQLPQKSLTPGTQFKFIILEKGSAKNVLWEPGDNHRIPHYVPGPHTQIILAGTRFDNPQARWRGAGTAIPVFSVRTKGDCGVGDFYSLKKVVDWCAQTGQTFLQILPINDTTMTGTWTDSYPYNANSTFALHPMYLNLAAMGKLTEKSRRDHYAALSAELNALPEVDYERVNQVKSEYYREIFAQEGKKVMASSAFKTFVKKNSAWLPAYAAFCVMRDKFGTPDFQMWAEYAQFTSKKLEKIISEHTEQINFVYYLQFNLDKQMRHVREYANARGVALKGDIPIGISRTSVDAWTDTRLFNMDCQAGAPPDDFSIMGQNWGFPTYNWEEMARDGFAWWKARFKKMSEYFDAYRIDHVLGFFRIWQIPMDALHGLLGYFNPALPYTADELRHSYDFWLNPDLHTRPYIMEYFLADFFGEYTDEVKEKYLVPDGSGRYRMRDGLETQRKIAAFFATLPHDDKHNRICNGLLGLIDDVLFIEDPVEKAKYHPRISAQYTYIYRSLNDYERWCFDRLYNDFFYRRHNNFWYGKAMWKLPPLIDATDMLVCAEDLGMIPDCVPAVMHALEILSLEIQRMPKDPSSQFGNTWSYPYMSVCTTSTHDMGGIRQWWEEDRDKTQQFYNDVLHEQGQAPQFCEPWLCKRIIDLHLKSPSMLCIIPLQDYLSTDGDIRRRDPREEQINVPANPRHYWRYRMHLNVEDLLKADAFNTALKSQIVQSGR